MARSSRYSPEFRERAVRMVREHGAEYPSQWAAIESIASKLGCTAETCGSGCGKPSATRGVRVPGRGGNSVGRLR
jgi:transposase